MQAAAEEQEAAGEAGVASSSVAGSALLQPKAASVAEAGLAAEKMVAPSIAASAAWSQATPKQLRKALAAAQVRLGVRGFK